MQCLARDPRQAPERFLALISSICTTAPDPSALLTIFAAWITAAQWLYMALYGATPPVALVDFLQQVAPTERLAIDRRWLSHRFLLCRRNASHQRRFVSSLLDRDVGAIIAIATSIKTVQEEPDSDDPQGLIVAAALLIGSLPFFMGLTVVVPVLGHATWHLYRKVIVRDPV